MSPNDHFCCLKARFSQDDRRYMNSNIIDVGAKMMENEHMPDLAIAAHFISIQRLDVWRCMKLN